MAFASVGPQAVKDQHQVTACLRYFLIALHSIVLENFRDHLRRYIMKTVPSFNFRRFLLAVAFFSGLGCVSHASAERAYLIDLNSRTATDLGTLGGDSSSAWGINDAGQVVGESYTAEGPDPSGILTPHAFMTGPGGAGMTDLGTLGGSSSRAFGINDAGEVVGSSDTRDGVAHAFITGPNGTGMRDLGTLGGDSSAASAINDAGQVAGASDAGLGLSHAFITDPGGTGMRDLGTLGGDASFANGVNSAGRVVGFSYTTEGAAAFITGPNGAGMRALGGGSADASGINDAGQVTGNFSMAGGGYHAFITGPDGTGLRDLGTLGGNLSSASGINEAGQVVGTSSTAEGFAHAFITGAGGVGMTDLNSLVRLPDGWVLTGATGINDAGQVIAAAIPEPESYALLLAGLALIAAVAWRKKGFGPFPALS
jgi:probable HAF family extracellular repeat protein